MSALRYDVVVIGGGSAGVTAALRASELGAVVAAGMAAAMRVEALAALEIAYPTYTAVLGLAARETARRQPQHGHMPQSGARMGVPTPSGSDRADIIAPHVICWFTACPATAGTRDQ
jgi:hypothetical protein